MIRSYWRNRLCGGFTITGPITIHVGVDPAVNPGDVLSVVISKPGSTRVYTGKHAIAVYNGAKIKLV